MSTINSINSNIRFSVGSLGIGLYQTIQSAITAAEAAGGGTVFIHPGSYTENLTFTTGTVQLLGFNAGSYISGAVSNVTITGIHTPPAAGILEARNIFFQSATHVFNSAVAGTATIILEQCSVEVDAGYTFNIPNWVGFVAKSLVEDASTDNGVINNTGGAAVQLQNANCGTSSTNPMITSGPVIIKKSEIGCTWNAGTGTSAQCDRAIFNQAIVFSGDASGQFNFCRLIGGSDAAYTHSTTGQVDFSCCIFNSSHVPCIDGAGVGVISVSDITFLDNGTFAALPGLTGQTAWMPSTFGTANQVFTSNGQGICPSFKAPTAGAATTVVAGFNNVLSATDTNVQTALDTLDDFGSAAGNQTVNLYTGAGVKVVTLGSTNTTSSTAINAGTAGLNIGANAVANSINLGTGAASKTITIGNVTTTTAVNINTGTGGTTHTTTNGIYTLATGTGAISISGDAAATTVGIATGAGIKTVTLGSGTTSSTTTVDCGTGGANFGTTNNLHTTTIGTANTNSVSTINSGAGGINLTAANGDVTVRSGSGTIYIGNDAVQHGVIIGNTTGTTSVTVDCGTNGASFGASATAHTTTVGSVTGASATTVQGGSGALNVTATGGALTINSGTGTLAISNDASATTVNIATGGAAKVVTMGNVTGATAVNINTGTAGTTHTTTNGIYTLATGTGTISLGADAVAKTITIGNVTGATGLTLNSGSAGITTGGVYGYNAGSIATIMTVANTGRLGTATLTAGAGISITPAANLLTVAATGSIATSYVAAASGNHTLNANTKSIMIMGFGGGAGGGSGKRSTSTAAGGGGGAAGGSFFFQCPASFFGGGGAAVPYAVGAGGTGGAAQTSDTTNGIVGNAGGVTSFGNIFTGITVSSYGAGGTATSSAGGNYSVNYDCMSNANGVAGGGGSNVNGTTSNITARPYAFATAGGGGAGADSVTMRTGGAGGLIQRPDTAATLLAGGTGGVESGTINGGAGQTGLTLTFAMVGGTGGGGGGGQSAGAVAGIGGNGGFPGGGGGGGGGSLNGTNSGKGGDGAAGALYIIEYL